MLHAAILRSPIAHGRLRPADASAARAMPGLHAVITAAEIGAVPKIPLRPSALPGTERFLQPVIAADACAMSADRSRSCRQIARRWPRTGSGRSSRILKSCRRSRIAGLRGNTTFCCSRRPAPSRDDLRRHPRRCRRGVSRCRLRPAREFPDAALYSTSDGAARLARRVGCARAIDCARRRQGALLQPRYLGHNGGCLKRTSIWSKTMSAAASAPAASSIPRTSRSRLPPRHVGRAVRWIEDRREHLIAMNHARQADCEVEIACRRDGTLSPARVWLMGPNSKLARSCSPP
jgi:carbon-monoxide dehydrogenase large subunit